MGLFSSSSSKSFVSTTTKLYDQRVMADNAAIAIGSGATYTYTDEFSDNVAAIFESLIDFAGEATTKVSDTAQLAQESLAQELERKQTLIPSVITEIMPYVAIGFFGIAALLLLKKR